MSGSEQRAAMEVVDHRPAQWYLMARGETYYLDANCNHGAFGYSVLIELDDGERRRWHEGGADYLDQLAGDIQWSAPAARGSTSPYRDRDLTRTPLRAEMSEAVRRWREAGSPRATV